MIKITLDTCCFDKHSLILIGELINLKNHGVIELYCDGLSKIEIDRWLYSEELTLEEKIKIRDLLNENFKIKGNASFVPIDVAEDPLKSLQHFSQQQGYTIEELHNTHIKIDLILHPEGFDGKSGRNKYVDGKILAKHIMEKRDFFVTKDKGFFKNGRKEKLEKAFPNIKIRILNEELIDELKHQI